MSKSWQDITFKEFETLATCPEGQANANRHHERIYGAGKEHSMITSCPCAHQAVQELLDQVTM